MDCIIIVMRKMEDAVKLGGVLRKKGFHPGLECSSAAEALSESSRRDSGIIICGSSLNDMSFPEFHDCLPKGFRLIILARDVTREDYPADALKIAMPFKPSALTDVLERELYRDYRKPAPEKEAKAARSPEDRKYIDRAKAVLMEKKGFSEPEAYRFIQKSSMDSSNSMVETAQMILLLNR